MRMHGVGHPTMQKGGGVRAAAAAQETHAPADPSYVWSMPMKRTTVYADPEDLAIIKEAAKRRGISEAEIIRQGIHLAAMANRVWDEPLFSRTFEGSGRTARQG
jgi:Ribbon-helix-helix protein, copG family